MAKAAETGQSIIERYFIFIVLAVSLSALWLPSGFIWVKPHIPKLLGMIMFGMGVSLKFSDFAGIWKRRNLVAAGVLLQFICMPLLAVVISGLFDLPKELTIGMIIVGACPGGTASNVMAYLSGANLALSVTLTLMSTLLAPLLTPAIIYLFLSQNVDISFTDMMSSVFWIVFFPLMDGLVLRHFLYKYVQKFISVFPTISILSITLIIGCVVALNRELLLSFPFLIFTAVLLHNISGLAIGYGAGKILKTSPEDAKTLAFEIGMQNSGLGVTLASQFFTALSTLPGAIFSVVHNVTGLSLANWWAGKRSNSDN